MSNSSGEAGWTPANQRTLNKLGVYGFTPIAVVGSVTASVVIGAAVLTHFYGGYSNLNNIAITTSLGAGIIAASFLVYCLARRGWDSVFDKPKTVKTADNTWPKNTQDTTQKTKLHYGSMFYEKEQTKRNIALFQLEFPLALAVSPLIGSLVLNKINGHTSSYSRGMASIGTGIGCVVGAIVALYLAYRAKNYLAAKCAKREDEQGSYSEVNPRDDAPHDDEIPRTTNSGYARGSSAET